MIDQSEILRYFEFSHLPIRLQPISSMFRELAWQIEAILPKGAEKSTALRKLLESKDAAIRSALDMPEGPVYYPQSPEPGDLIRASTAAFNADAPNPGRKGWPTPPEAAGAVTLDSDQVVAAIDAQLARRGKSEGDGNWLDANDPDPTLHPMNAPTAKGPDWPDEAEEDANR